MVVFAASALVPIVLFLVIFVGIVVGYYTKRGTDVAQRPSDGLGRDSESAAPGAEGSSRIAGVVDGEQDSFDTHGTH